MKAGINLDSEKVFIELPSEEGLHVTVEMAAREARLIASQLLSCAETLDKAIKNGLIDNSDD